MLAAACIWTGRPAPVTTRRLFFHGHGSLADPQTLGKVLKAPPGYDFGLVPAVLEGWRGLVPERVEGCTCECAGRLIPLIEDYHGERYAPVEVTVSVARAGGLEERVRAWCYIWDGASDELWRDDDPAT